MTQLNAADRKSVRAAEKAAAIADRERGETIATIASTTSGRRYLWEKLEAAHIFTSVYNDLPERMAFLEGERNQGLQLLGDIVQYCPDQFLEMMREANGRRTRSDTASSAAPGERPSDEGPDGDDQGPSGDTGAEG